MRQWWRQTCFGDVRLPAAASTLNGWLATPASHLRQQLLAGHGLREIDSRPWARLRTCYWPSVKLYNEQAPTLECRQIMARSVMSRYFYTATTPYPLQHRDNIASSMLPYGRQAHPPSLLAKDSWLWSPAHHALREATGQWDYDVLEVAATQGKHPHGSLKPSNKMGPCPANQNCEINIGKIMPSV